MISSLQSAMTGLQAFATKIHSSANNIANSNTHGYKRTQVNLSSMAPNGVKADVGRSTDSGPLVPETTTDGLEMVEYSNVDLGRELVDMMVSSHSYKANLKTIATSDEMLGSILNLKA